VVQIISVVLKSLDGWQNKERSDKWKQFMCELETFSSLPHFFEFFMKDKYFIELLFQLLAGLPDQPEPI